MAATGSPTFRSLGVPAFRSYFIGHLVSQTGTWMTMITVAIYVYRETDSGAALGLLTACQFGPMLLLGAWGGVVADRSDKRVLLVRAQWVSMATSLVLAGLAFSGSAPLWLFFVVVTVWGVAAAMDMPARRSFIIEIVPEDAMQNATALNGAVLTGARVLGPAFAGVLIGTVGYGWCFLVDGISYLAMIIALQRIDPASVRSERVARAPGQVRAGLAYLRGVPVLAQTMVMMIVVGTISYNFPVVFPVLVEDSLGGGTAQLTLLFSISSVGSVVGALYAARRTTAGMGDVCLACLVFGVAMLALAAAPSVPVALAAGLGVGFGSVLFLTLSTSLIQHAAAPAMRGRVLALHGLVFLGSTPVGGPLLGVVCDLFGGRAGVAVGGAAAVAAAAYGRLRDLRRVVPAVG